MNYLSFFSGCLGLDIGFEQAGMCPRLYCEFDPVTRQTITQNRPNIPLINDILDYSAEQILESADINRGDVDVIVGGPPCQAFSTAGKRESFQDPRGNVFLHFISIISEIRPKYFVIENVRGLLSAALKHRPLAERGADYPPLSKEELPGGALSHVINSLEQCGYKISFNLYNTANYGVAQKRERLIIIGCLEGRVPYITPTHSEDGSFGLLRWRTFSDAASDLTSGAHEYVKFSEKRKRFYQHLTGGQNWRDLPLHLVREAMGKSYEAGGGKTGFYRRIAWDEPSPTLVTHPAMPATDLCHPDIIRPLSVEEYKRLQNFPDDYLLSGTTLQKYKQLGNAVPVCFAQKIAEHLMNFEHKKISSEVFQNFPYSRYKNTNDKSWTDHGTGKKQSSFAF